MASLLRKNWTSEKNNDNLKTLFDKYKSPKNLEISIPKVNVELWKSISSVQRKQDVKISGMQKSLVKDLNANILMFNEICNKNINKQQIAQTLIDVSAILGRTFDELTVKRRIQVRSGLKDDFKDLTVSKPIDESEFLFGDNLAQTLNSHLNMGKLRNHASEN